MTATLYKHEDLKSVKVVKRPSRVIRYKPIIGKSRTSTIYVYEVYVNDIYERTFDSAVVAIQYAASIVDPEIIMEMPSKIDEFNNPLNPTPDS